LDRTNERARTERTHEKEGSRERERKLVVVSHELTGGRAVVSTGAAAEAAAAATAK